jgi:hypothetical protein
MDLSKIVLARGPYSREPGIIRFSMSSAIRIFGFRKNFSCLPRERLAAPILSVSPRPTSGHTPLETTGIEPATSGLQSRRSPS